MGKIVDSKKLRNIMTLATDLNYSFFSNIFYNGYYCLSSVAIVKEDIPLLNLYEGQTVVTSPMIDNNVIDTPCFVYRAIDINAESGLFIPIISWALEFTKHIIMRDMSVRMEKSNGLVESLLLQVWKYEEVAVSESGLDINLLEPKSWKPISDEKIKWEDYDSLMHAEAIIKNGVVEMNNELIPHAHTENINYFCKEDTCKGLILDW